MEDEFQKLINNQIASINYKNQNELLIKKYNENGNLQKISKG